MRPSTRRLVQALCLAAILAVAPAAALVPASASDPEPGEKSAAREGVERLWGAAGHRVLDFVRHLFRSASAVPDGDGQDEHTEELGIFHELMDASLAYGQGLGEPPESDPPQREAEAAELDRVIGL